VTQTALFQRVVQHIGEYLETNVSHLTLDSRPATALPGLDSLKVFEMFLYLEDRFGLEFDDTVMEHFETLGDLVAYIEKHMSAEARAAV
jgi:acyl carrier protein